MILNIFILLRVLSVTCSQILFIKNVGQKVAFYSNNVKARFVSNISDECVLNMIVIVWQLDIQLHMRLAPITNNVVSSNHAHGEAYSIQHYVIKLVSGLLRVLLFSPQIKLINRWNIVESGFKHRILNHLVLVKHIYGYIATHILTYVYQQTQSD